MTVREFSGALEKVLRSFKPVPPPSAASAASAVATRVSESDLDRLAGESGAGCELLFFSRLRDELRHHLRQTPRILRFHGLRPCVKRLVGTSRWTRRCRHLEEQIVAFLRQCLSVEAGPADFGLVVE